MMTTSEKKRFALEALSIRVWIDGERQEWKEFYLRRIRLTL
ncbi:hypothetical protein ACFLXF_04510 [Chloroflexota bacterium]